MNRPDVLQTFMELAEVWSKRSTCSSKISVGAVIVNADKQVIASGYNGSPRGHSHCNDVGCVKDSDGHCLSAIHAEENAILQCAMNGVSTKDCMLFVTHSPCFKCAMRIAQVGILGVCYKSEYGNLKHTKEVLRVSDVKIWRLNQ